MKQLLVLLIEKLDHPWWRLRSSEGDPPAERDGHYILPRLREMIGMKLNRVSDHEDKDNRT